jgi:hypothetical protein
MHAILFAFLNFAVKWNTALFMQTICWLPSCKTQSKNGRHLYCAPPLSTSIFFSVQSSLPNKRKQTPWPQSSSELYRPSERRLSAKLMPSFEEEGCNVVSVADP